MARALREMSSAASRQKTLLLVWHSRTGLAEQMSNALERGAYECARQMECGERIVVQRRRASEATAEEVLSASGYLFCAPENLASTSGEMLEFFHRCYYHMFDAQKGDGRAKTYSESSKLIGRPVGIAVAAGSDGTNAARQMERICRGWRLNPVAESIINRNGQPQTAQAILAPKTCTEEARQKCEELGGLVAASILLHDEV